jgi:uncharacterized membrane protein
MSGLRRQIWAAAGNKAIIHRGKAATAALSLRSLYSSTPLEDAMERELTPVEARGGVISGRVITVLAISFAGAVIALAGVWAIIGMPN